MYMRMFIVSELGNCSMTENVYWVLPEKELFHILTPFMLDLDM